MINFWELVVQLGDKLAKKAEDKKQKAVEAKINALGILIEKYTKEAERLAKKKKYYENKYGKEGEQ